jgi:16S rRNA (guanine1207-N2)-methyltransferase
LKARNGFAQRLQYAQAAGLSLPDDCIVLQPDPGTDLGGIAHARIVHPFRPAHDHFASRQFAVSPQIEGRAEAVIVCLPRAKAEAYAMVAEAAAHSAGLIVVDGGKTDGVDSLLKAMRARAPVGGVVSKAHGKMFWCAAADDDFSDWAQGPELTEDGFWSAPGVFSADGVDEGSALLASVLPEDMSGAVADLGAGWGFLSMHILTRPAVTTLHLVEAHHMALQCAEHNVVDPRARFHWADACNWMSPETLNTVVMNPPFHNLRQADPTLGQAFIEAAARALKPKGQLFMVANRHLPYEENLARLFRAVNDLGGNGRFKLFRAEAPRRA